MSLDEGLIVEIKGNNEVNGLTTYGDVCFLNSVFGKTGYKRVEFCIDGLNYKELTEQEIILQKYNVSKMLRRDYERA